MDRVRPLCPGATFVTAARDFLLSKEFKSRMTFATILLSLTSYFNGTTVLKPLIVNFALIALTFYELSVTSSKTTFISPFS